jgi:hypothetical protein
LFRTKKQFFAVGVAAAPAWLARGAQARNRAATTTKAVRRTMSFMAFLPNPDWCCTGESIGHERVAKKRDATNGGSSRRTAVGGDEWRSAVTRRSS